ncbi:MAG: hypothetical protein JW723_05445 [Bacteroidales bacterium]|nr:hypothetical protein [Bacteroidales bacterium]
MKPINSHPVYLNFKNAITDRLYRFSDAFFDDSREKTDFTDMRYVRYIIRNSGMAYLVLKKKSSGLIPVLTGFYEIFSDFVDSLGKTSGILINKLLSKTETMLNDFHNIFINRETDAYYDAFLKKTSITSQVIIALNMAGILRNKRKKATVCLVNERELLFKSGLVKERELFFKRGTGEWFFEPGNFIISASPG